MDDSLEPLMFMQDEDEDDLELELDSLLEDEAEVVKEGSPPLEGGVGHRLNALKEAYMSKVAEARAKALAKMQSGPSQSGPLQNQGDQPSHLTEQKTATENARSEKAELGYTSDDATQKPNGPADMTAFQAVASAQDGTRGALSAMAPSSMASGAKAKASGSQGQPKGGAAKKQPAAKADFVEEHSELRIKDRLLPSLVVKERLSEKRFIRLPAIRYAMAGGQVSGEWATIAVVAEKSTVLQSKAGSSYMRWQLSTLQKGPGGKAGGAVTLFLFGAAYKEHWRESQGSVVAIVDAETIPPNKDFEPGLKVFGAHQVMKLGTSMDFATCKGETKAGSPCNVVVDKRSGGYCHFHVGAAYKKIRSTRTELDGGNLARSFLQKNKRVTSSTLLADDEAQQRAKRPKRAARLVSDAQIKSILESNDSMTSKAVSQGKRFLAVVSNSEDPHGTSLHIENGRLTKRVRGLPHGMTAHLLKRPGPASTPPSAHATSAQKNPSVPTRPVGAGGSDARRMRPPQSAGQVSEEERAKQAERGRAARQGGKGELGPQRLAAGATARGAEGDARRGNQVRGGEGPAKGRAAGKGGGHLAERGASSRLFGGGSSSEGSASEDEIEIVTGARNDWRGVPVSVPVSGMASQRAAATGIDGSGVSSISGTASQRTAAAPNPAQFVSQSQASPLGLAAERGASEEEVGLDRTHSGGGRGGSSCETGQQVSAQNAPGPGVEVRVLAGGVILKIRGSSYTYWGKNAYGAPKVAGTGVGGGEVRAVGAGSGLLPARDGPAVGASSRLLPGAHETDRAQEGPIETLAGGSVGVHGRREGKGEGSKGDGLEGEQQLPKISGQDCRPRHRQVPATGEATEILARGDGCREFNWGQAGASSSPRQTEGGGERASEKGSAKRSNPSAPGSAAPCRRVIGGMGAGSTGGKPADARGESKARDRVAAHVSPAPGSALAHAVATIKATGGLKPLNPNATSWRDINPHEPARRRNVPLDMAAVSLAATHASASGPRATGASASFAAAFGKVAADMEMHEDSRFSMLVSEEDDERLLGKMDVLAQKDELQQKMEGIVRAHVKAWHCRQCNESMEQKPLGCAKKGHTLDFVKDAVKRFFECVACRAPTHTIDKRYPDMRCFKCHTFEFRPASMYKKMMKKGPLLEGSRESFLARGTEHAFSLKTL